MKTFLTSEKASVVSKIFLRIQSSSTHIIKMKKKLGARSVRETQIHGIAFNLELQFSGLSINSTINGFFVMSLLFSSFWKNVLT